MNRLQVSGVILKRVNYGEADRILTFLTQDAGKVTGIAKGVRKQKSKLAGGLELFSVCDISLVKGRGSMYTVVSTRLKTYFDQLTSDYDRMTYGYDAIRLVDAYTDDESSQEHYELLVDTLTLLNSNDTDDNVVQSWFLMQLSKLNGSLPNVLTDGAGENLQPDTSYAFSIEDGTFFKSEMGIFTSDEIKAWRVFISADARQIQTITGLGAPAEKTIVTLKHFTEFQL